MHIPQKYMTSFWIRIENRLIATVCMLMVVCVSASIAHAQTAPTPAVTRIAEPIGSPAAPAAVAPQTDTPRIEKIPDYPQMVPVGQICPGGAPCGPAPINGVYCAGCRYCGELGYTAFASMT
jgi:hypothetical protein